MRINPVIKWSGSKRTQAETILQNAPESFDEYYEPFLGGGSILYALAPSKATCGDICEPLIDLWEEIKNNPSGLADQYRKDWTRLQEGGYEVFYEVRDRFNKTKDPKALLFLSRTCVNGLIRFNGNGEFNNSFHHTRPGINPDRLEKIIQDWSGHIQTASFFCKGYRETTATASTKSFVYLDPPYLNTKGRYYGGISFEELMLYLEDLNKRGVKFALSFDGKRGEHDYTAPIPEELYKRKIMIASGKSTFRKVQDKANEEVFESLYLNY